MIRLGDHAAIIAEALDVYGVRLDQNDVLRGDDGVWRINGTDEIDWFAAHAAPARRR